MSNGKKKIFVRIMTTYLSTKDLINQKFIGILH